MMRPVAQKRQIGAFFLQNNIYAVMLLLLFVPMFFFPKFGTPASLTVLFKNVALWGIMAIGMTFVLLLGYNDMSIGMNASMLTVIMVQIGNNHSAGLAIPAVLIIGTLLGVVNGLIVTKLKINFFITTLGTQVLFKGIGLLLCNGSPIVNENEIIKRLFETKIMDLGIFTLTLPMLVMLVCLVVAVYVQRRTRFGYNIYVTGGNIEAANLSGINTDLVTIGCYAIVGFTAGITAVLLTSFQSSGNAAFGEKYVLQTIAACVLGGIRMTGGYGDSFRALLGVMSFQLIVKLLYQVSSSMANMQIGIIGVILIIVLILDKLSTNIKVKRT